MGRAACGWISRRLNRNNNDAFQLCALSGRFGVSRSEGLWCLGGKDVANVRTHAMPASHVGQVREPSTAGAIYRRLMLVLVPISLLLLMYQEPASVGRAKARARCSRNLSRP